MKIPTNNGKLLDLVDPQPDDIDGIDIAHGLAAINRFNGQTQLPYSVAEHSIHVALLVPPEHSLTALLHDAAETYIGDVVSPVRAALHTLAGADVVQELEDRVWIAIAERFGLPAVLPDAVVRADRTMCSREAHQLLPRHEPAQLGLPPPVEPGPILPCWAPPVAAQRWMMEFRRLGGF